MSQSLLNKVWSFLGTLLLYLCLNVWSITQQWQLSFPGNPFKVENVSPHGVTLYGVPICGLLLVLVSIVTRIYASRALKLDTSKPEAKAFQVIMFVELLLLPVAAVVHFQITFFSGTVCGLAKNFKTASALGCECTVRISGWHAMLFESRQVAAGVTLKYDPNVTKNIGPSFVQTWEPWGYLVITFIAVCSVTWCAKTIFQPELHRFKRAVRRKS